MSIAINFFDEVTFDLRFGNDGRLVVEFRDRPLHPHITAFFDPDEDENHAPHFTAARGRRNQFRRTLLRVRHQRLLAAMERFKEEGPVEFAKALVPANLVEFTAEGWLAIWANPAPLERWVRIGCRRGSEIRISEQTVLAVADHVLRHLAPPTELLKYPFEQGARLMLLRLGDTDDGAELRTLVFCPNGYWVKKGESVTLARPPGWYTHTMNGTVDVAVDRLMPAERINAIGAKLKRYLARYPLRRERRSRPSGADPFPAVASAIFGFYAIDLLYMLLDATEPAPEPAASSSP